MSAGGRVSLTLGSALANAHDVWRDSPAILRPEGEVMTYGELGRAARQLASGLHAQGVRPGDRVIIVSKNRPECIVADHALAVGGFIRVALSHRLHAQEVVQIVRDCDPAALLLDADSLDGVRSALAAHDLRPRLVSLDTTMVEDATHWSSLLGHGEADYHGADPEETAWMPYTSGTTGAPKGVMLSHRSLLACARNLMVELPPIEEIDVVLHVAPLTHLSGYIGLTYALRGATQTTLQTFHPEETLAAIEEHRVTVLPMAPTMITMLLPHIESGEHDVSSLHTILYGGSPIAPDRLARAIKAFGNVFVQGYGLTEVPFPLTAMSKHAHSFDMAAPPPERLASAGRVNPFVQLRLVDSKGTDVGEGDEGEIWVRGDTTMTGYWGRPDETEQMIAPDNWFKTGDIARRVDGYVHIVDRKKDVVVSGGFNVYPGEVEKVIYQLEGVQEVTVVGVPDARWGESVRAVVVVRPGSQVSEDDIADICLRHLAAYKRPRSVEFIDELPKTATGKILRRELRDRYWSAGEGRQVGGA